MLFPVQLLERAGRNIKLRSLREVKKMADCIACSYPMLQVASGQVVGLNFKKDKDLVEILKKHDIVLKEDDPTKVGCYVCPECGNCIWLEE